MESMTAAHARRGSRQRAALLALGPAWLALVLLLHFREGTRSASLLQRLDITLRWFLVAAIAASGVYSTATGRLAAFPWVAAKLWLFAFLIFCGLMIRRSLPPFVAGYRALAAGEPDAETDRRMRDSLARMRPWVLAIWAGLLASAVLGLVKPGD